MPIQKIKISQLKVGMFIVAMDISWIRSPFLKHSRLIKNSNDIKLLLQAGVKEVSIDTDKTILETPKLVKNEGVISSQENLADNLSQEAIIAAKEPNIASNDAEKKVASNSKHQASTLSKELETAAILKQQAYEALSNLSNDIKNDKPIKVKEVLPIIDDSIDSLIRNNQALLTLMHMQRSKKELFTHSFSVMSLALSLAISLDYSAEKLTKIGAAALLHDLGWFKLPLNLLVKNKKYSENELKVIQQHIFIVIQQLSSSPDSDPEVIKMIAEHHERGDGSGYPKGIKLDDMGEESSLLALVDSYDELTHGLSDHPGVIPSLALKLLYKETLSGKFHKKQVEQLITLLGIYPLTSAVKLKTGEKAVVIEINKQSPLKPSVNIFYDKAGRPMVKPFFVDLNEDIDKRVISQIVDLNDPLQDPMGLLVVKEQGGPLS